MLVLWLSEHTSTYNFFGTKSRSTSPVWRSNNNNNSNNDDNSSDLGWVGRFPPHGKVPLPSDAGHFPSDRGAHQRHAPGTEGGPPW